MSKTAPEIDTEALEARIAALPGVAEVRAAVAAADVEAYLVGGAVRDALLGASRADLDVTVAGDQLALVDVLGGEARVHDRFGTATVASAAGAVDVAHARAERYPTPGALPEVTPAAIGADLARRDFSINALAVPLFGDFELLDPHGGVADLRAGTIRVLHDRSIADDPTRALRAARYAARLRFLPEPETLAQIRDADLTTISRERVEAELRLIAGEAETRAAFELLDQWGLERLAGGGAERIDAVCDLLARAPWQGVVERGDAVLAARRDPGGSAVELARAQPLSPSAAVEAARGRLPAELLIARALGAQWLDRYVAEWRHVRLEISGRDLLAAGLPEGPAVGAGLAAALRAKLDGEAAGRDDELRLALEAARG